MGLDQVLGEVRRDGDGRADAILKRAREEAEAILATARQQAQSYETERLAAAQRDAALRQAQALSRAESEARKAVLAAETTLRLELRKAVLDALAELPDKQRSSHLKTLVKKAREVVPEGKAWGAAADAKALASHKEYKHAGDLPMAGGIVVESTAGDARLDLSYETLLDEIWREVLKAEAPLFAS
ncbi:MAG: V-type ATP synthase subunit E family protein [Thermoplasmatota archaeon]